MLAAGIFGVISYTTSRRTQEIGIRVAVGATLRELHLMIFRQGFATVALGLVIGIVPAVQPLHLPGGFAGRLGVAACGAPVRRDSGGASDRRIRLLDSCATCDWD
jgi:hypothetical protein